MDKRELQKKLNQPYSTNNWKEVVQFVFPNVSLRDRPTELIIDSKYKDIVESFKQLGDVVLNDGKILALLELKVKENVNVLRNRVQLNEVVSSVIDSERANGVLSIFEKGTDDYRFTFAAHSNEFNEIEEDFVQAKTDTKRFTYVLGKNESCKTPAMRFYELSQNKEHANIDEVIKAFNVAKLNKEFFDEYKEIYSDIVQYFTGKRIVKSAGKWVEKEMNKPDDQLTNIFKNNEKAVRDFVKIFLGRIVFLKFVQKKGWMGNPATEKGWQNGDIHFLENAFKNFENKDLFYSSFLVPLFFDNLDKGGRKNDIFNITGTKIPHLSGGLFDLDNEITRNTNIPKIHFEKLFDFLERYNFTIDENVDISDENEFTIDPEMLGHIFENLLEDNKDKGAYYTPKEIVRYMCQESLKEYLKSCLKSNNQWPKHIEKIEIFEDALSDFIIKKEAGGIIEFEETIIQALKQIKICDPAIGSGAFPMGMLNEIFQLVHKIYDVSSDKVERIWGLKGWQPNIVKQNIIQNSIYGVDIEKGAVDIARLRFWLSLIVDESEPKALPHLDYKIVAGNSLMSMFDDTVIDIDWNLNETEHGLFGSELAQERATILQKISDKQIAVFDPSSDEDSLSLEIRNLKIDLLCKQLELMIERQNLNNQPKVVDYQNKPKAKFLEDEKKYLETLGWKKQIKKLSGLKNHAIVPLHFFDWKLDFPEIMNEKIAKKIGFDIVIGNPPYLRVQGIRESSPEFANELVKRYKSATGSFDLYATFLEKGLSIVNHDGIVNFIMPVKWTNASFGSGLRQIVSETNSAYKMISFGAYQVFNASTYTGLQWYKRNSENLIYFELNQDLKSNEHLRQYLASLNIDGAALISADKLKNESWTLTNSKTSEILKKINQHPRNMGDIFEKIFQGLATSKDDVYFLYNCKFEDNYVIGFSKQLNLSVKIEKTFTKPLLKGNDVHRYESIKSDRVVIFPYKLIGDSATLYLEDEIKNDFPLSYSYLKQCESILRDREKGRFNIDGEWFQFGRKQGISSAEKEKLVAPEISFGGNFSYDENGEFYSTTTIYGYIKKTSVEESYKCLMALLNSSLFWWYLVNTGVVLANGYFRFKPYYIKPFPVPTISKKVQKEIEVLVDKIHAINNNSSKENIMDYLEDLNNIIYDLYQLNPEEINSICLI